jgi:hypothetical protein
MAAGMPPELECESERRSTAKLQQSLFRLYLAATQRRIWSHAPSAGDHQDPLKPFGEAFRSEPKAMRGHSVLGRKEISNFSERMSSELGR